LCENSINIYEDDIKNLIEKYINLYDNKIFKYKKTRSLFMKASRGQLREFLREEEYKRTKGFRKLFLKWRKITGGE